MAVKLITFDLNNKSDAVTDYAGFRRYIENHNHIKVSDSAYAFESDADVRDIYQTLKAYIAKTDTVLIITIKKPFSGRQKSSLMDWLNDNLEF